MPLLSEDFLINCENATIYLDTNIFIVAQDNDSLIDVLQRMKQQHAALLTISSVEYEFSRGSRNLDELRTRREFVRTIASGVLPVGKLLESDHNDAFSAVMSIIVGKKNSDYTDYLLATALHTFHNGVSRQLVLSADARAFPTSLFDIVGVISLSGSHGEIQHINLIALNHKQYSTMTERVVRQQ